MQEDSVFRYILWHYIKKCEHGDDCPYCCWEWQGKCTHEGGYGSLYYCSAQYLAHRAAYELFNECSLREDKCCHHCDNPPCCNPMHLFKGTQRDNILDSVRKKRWFKMWVTTCPKGHPYDLENTYTAPNGHHGCKICRRESTKAWRARSREDIYAF